MHDGISPRKALELWLADRTDKAQSTRKTNRSRVGMFVDHLDVAHVGEIQPIHLHEYKADQQGITDKTLLSRLSDVFVWLKWLSTMGTVDADLPETCKALYPQVDASRDTSIGSDRAAAISEYLSRLRYASRDHAVWLLLWRCGIRSGSVRAIDLRDVGGDSIKLRHRPDATPLKNKHDGERQVALNGDTAAVIDDYRRENRVDTTDDGGRVPLLTTVHGRLSIVALRRTVYRITRPCVYSDECPAGRDPAECSAANDYDKASQCPPSGVSPHDVRRGSITHHLRNEVPKAVVSDRCDVSAETLDKHYNQLNETERMERRRGFLDNL